MAASDAANPAIPAAVEVGSGVTIPSVDNLLALFAHLKYF